MGLDGDSMNLLDAWHSGKGWFHSSCDVEKLELRNKFVLLFLLC